MYFSTTPDIIMRSWCSNGWHGRDAGSGGPMKSTFLALAIATAALNLFAPTVGHAQDYIVNGHSASKAEARFLASYSAPAGHWQVDGYGVSRVADEHPAPPVVKTAGRKCWYVLDVQLCD
jgi:hypothetical protein